MLSQIIYLARAAASFSVTAIGLILLVAAASKPTAWTIGIAALIAGGGALAWPRRPNSWRSDKPTDRQLAYAKDLGIPLSPDMTKGQVSDLIAEFKDAI